MKDYNNYNTIVLSNAEKVTLTGGKRITGGIFHYSKGVAGSLRAAFRINRDNLLRIPCEYNRQW